MMGFESSVLDTVEVMEHVSALLHGHWSLLRQFNDFLPDGHRIEQLPPRLQGYSVCHDSAQPVPEAQADELAVGFFNRLKARCRPTHNCEAAIPYVPLWSEGLQPIAREAAARV